MSGNLSGQVAIVTGAARGIGLAIAQRLHREGASVVLADRDLDEASKAANSLRERAAVFFLDVTDPESSRSVAQQTFERFGSLDILVNNAGIAGLTSPAVDYPVVEWRRILAVNLDGVFYCCRAVLPYMLKQKRGRIINIASISGKEGNPNMSAYSTSKAGVIGLTKSLGKELARSGVLVNCVTPAVVQTEILNQVSQEAIDYMVTRIPMGRTGLPEEVASMVSWLSSSECSFSTGAVFDISGGRATY